MIIITSKISKKIGGKKYSKGSVRILRSKKYNIVKLFEHIKC